ncbi:MAG: YggS family pyridoxal phosphate-dependent enzyme [Acidobacteriota bacterium]
MGSNLERTRLASVRERIAAACARVGRDESEVELIAVSKRHSVESIEALARAGQRAFGESRLQEADGKIKAMPDLSWHMVGPIQSNKARGVARAFDVVHSVDRLKVARLLDSEAAARSRKLRVFAQIKLADELSKGGFEVQRLEHEVRPLAELESLEVVGFMAIPPREEAPEGSRRWFRQLRQCRDMASAWGDWHDWPGALSMGMSRDFEIAIEEGATHVRVGSDIFGPRPR